MKSFKDHKKQWAHIYEASLQGRTSSYSGSTGAFKQYVELSPQITEYELEKPAELYQMDGTTMNETLKKGTKLKIVDRFLKHITKVGRSDAIKVNITDRKYKRYKNQDFLIHLNKILKPTGKHVEVMAVDLNDKIDSSVFTPFKAGHGHEGQFTEAWIKGSGDAWQFTYKAKEHRITELRAPIKDWAGGGNPKTDVTVVLDKTLAGFKTNKLKYSLKSLNATYYENWMRPSRFEDIFGMTNGVKILNGALKELRDTGKIGGTSSKSPYLDSFIAKKWNYGAALTKVQNMEVLSGNQKFGSSGEGSANMFYGGDVPNKGDVIGEIIKKSSTAAAYSSKLKCGLSIRGSVKKANSNMFVRGEDDQWYISQSFLDHGFKVDAEFIYNPDLIQLAAGVIPESSKSEDKYAPGSKGHHDPAGWEATSKKQADLRKQMWKNIANRLKNRRSQNTPFDKKSRTERKKKKK